MQHGKEKSSEKLSIEKVYRMMWFSIDKSFLRFLNNSLMVILKASTLTSPVDFNQEPLKVWSTKINLINVPIAIW